MATLAAVLATTHHPFYLKATTAPPLVFSIVSGLDILTAVLALVVLKPMRQRFLTGDAVHPEPAASLL